MFQMYTPLLVLLIGIVLLGWGVGIAVSSASVDRMFPRWAADRRAGVDLRAGVPALRGRVMLDLEFGQVAIPDLLSRAFAFGRAVVSVGPFALALFFLLITMF